MVYRKTVWLLLFLIFYGICYAADPAAVEIRQITAATWMHTSWSIIEGKKYDSHGLIIKTPSGIVLVDTCWNVEQTVNLLKDIKTRFNIPVITAIITHAHQDRIGGIEALLENDIKTVSTPLTAQKAAAAGFAEPSPELDKELMQLEFGSFKIEVFYPGPGHTEDNIVVWIPADYVLFGGCLIKALENKNLGNVKDADVPHWAGSVQNVRMRYPGIKIVIPGHGRPGGADLLRHTIELAARLLPIQTDSKE